MARDRHEIDVSLPPGDDMDVHMVGETGPGRLPEVNPDIVAVRFHGHVQKLLHGLKEVEQALPLMTLQITDVADMPVRDN
jgi:hypothetical protein